MSRTLIRFLPVLFLILFPLLAFASTCPNLYRNLSYGSRGPDVVELQNFLIVQGDLAAGKNSGYFGRLTQSAVQKWQCKNMNICSGSPSTNGWGSVGPKTRAAITKSCSKVSTVPPSSYAQSIYYSQGSYQSNYSQGGYYAQGTYTSSYSQGTYYSQSSYYSQGTYSPPSQTHVAVSAPVLVIPNSKYNPAAHGIIDGTLSTFVSGGMRYWFNPGNTTALFRGTLDDPFQSLVYEKTNAQLFTNIDPIHGYWILNVYQDSAGLLGFIHVETPKMINGNYSSGKGRLGLAWSSDGGNTFKYLGDIMVPFGDPDPFNVNGLPYLIKDGYFYVYGKDNCNGSGADWTLTSVIRAPFADVIAAAKNGTVTAWKKYYNGSWGSDGIGGQCSWLNLEKGVNHSDAAYSTYTGKYYQLQTIENWYGTNTWLRLYESSDGINWALSATLVEQVPSSVVEGWQYSTIVDESGNDNGVVGQRFYVYASKEPYHSGSTYRWLVDLGGQVPISAGNFKIGLAIYYSNGSDYCAYDTWEHFVAYNNGLTDAFNMRSYSDIPPSMHNGGICQGP